MWKKADVARRIFAAVLVVVFAFAVQPVVMAMPAPVASQSMTDKSSCMDCCAQDMTKAPQKHQQNAPCKDMANCPSMQSCATAPLIPQDGAVLWAPIRMAGQLWHPLDRGPGITHQPDNPPPIA